MYIFDGDTTSATATESTLSSGSEIVGISDCLLVEGVGGRREDSDKFAAELVFVMGTKTSQVSIDLKEDIRDGGKEASMASSFGEILDIDIREVEEH